MILVIDGLEGVQDTEFKELSFYGGFANLEFVPPKAVYDYFEDLIERALKSKLHPDSCKVTFRVEGCEGRNESGWKANLRFEFLIRSLEVQAATRLAPVGKRHELIADEAGHQELVKIAEVQP